MLQQAINAMMLGTTFVLVAVAFSLYQIAIAAQFTHKHIIPQPLRRQKIGVVPR